MAFRDFNVLKLDGFETLTHTHGAMVAPRQGPLGAGADIGSAFAAAEHHIALLVSMPGAAEAEL